MALVQKVITVGLVGVALVSLIRGKPLFWSDRRPAPPPWLVRAYGLALLLLAAAAVAIDELHAPELAIGLFIPAMFLGLLWAFLAGGHERN